MNESMNLALAVVLGGFALAFVFGFVAMRANFCTMGAMSDVVNMGHWGRMRMWLLAIAVAIVGASAAAVQRAGRPGQVDLRSGRVLSWLSADRRRAAVRRRHDAGRRLRQQATWCASAAAACARWWCWSSSASPPT
ncbi:MAG: YeeE/YedE family protein [Chromatiales bacterium]|nr:YeeE/YedE family protein [Chromatiales bacterium]